MQRNPVAQINCAIKWSALQFNRLYYLMFCCLVCALCRSQYECECRSWFSFRLTDTFHYYIHSVGNSYAEFQWNFISFELNMTHSTEWFSQFSFWIMAETWFCIPRRCCHERIQIFFSIFSIHFILANKRIPFVFGLVWFGFIVPLCLCAVCTVQIDAELWKSVCHTVISFQFV